MKIIQNKSKTHRFASLRRAPLILLIRTIGVRAIEEVLRKLRASTNYEKVAKNREGWRKITKEALIQLGSKQNEEEVHNS